MKNSFVMYTDYMQHLEIMDMEQRGVFLTAVMKYASGGELPEMDGMVRMAFSFAKAQMDRDNEQYQKTIEARREAGRQGGIAKANSAKQNMAKVANASIASQTVANLPDTVTDNDTVLKKKDTDVSKEKASRFLPPTLDEVRSYCLEKGYPVDAERFIDFYESKGWFVGKNKMKDWKAAVRNWNRMQREDGAAKASGQRQADSAKGKNRFNNFEQRQNDYGNMVWDEIKRRANEGST